MKKSRFSEEQIIAVLKEVESGLPIADICRKYNVSDATIYNWKNKYSGMTASDLKKLKQLEDENNRLKKLVAEQALDIQALKFVVGKNY